MDHEFIGNHPSIKKIRELISMVSDTSFSVLLLGETGTGKEVVARLLHKASPRKRERFIKVNCAALPETLLESELFGYEKGAFTGAERMKLGKFELAAGGVIFLDEIGDMPLALQGKILNVLQSGDFTRLGGVQDITVDTWVISSTHHNLEKDIRHGSFREDLYYRLNIIRIELPPLRERTEDISLLTEHLIKKHRRSLGMEVDYFRISKELTELFEAYHWPGNIRELSHTILRLMVGGDPEAVKSELLHAMQADNMPLPMETFAQATGEKPEKEERDKESDGLESLKDVKAMATRRIQEKVILNALSVSGWNKRKAAERLKISYKTLFNKINELGIGKRESGNVK